MYLSSYSQQLRFYNLHFMDKNDDTLTTITTHSSTTLDRAGMYQVHVPCFSCAILVPSLGGWASSFLFQRMS